MLTIEELKQNLAVLMQQKEQSLLNFHQILGAVTLVEQMIKNIESNNQQKDEAVMDSLPMENKKHVETHDQAAEQVA